MDASETINRGAGGSRFRIGQLECTALWDGYIHFGYDLGGYPTADLGEMERLKQAHGLPADHIPMDLNPVVVDTGERMFLIDAGMGQSSQMFGDSLGMMARNMSMAGIDPRRIDAVLMTHLHPDHCGGLINASGEAAFPNATLYCARADWEEWTDERKLTAGSYHPDWAAVALSAISPYRERLRIFEAGDQLFPELTTLSIAGHSAGMVAYIFDGGSEKIIFTGDLCHHHVFDLAHPEWLFHNELDYNPGLAALAKARTFASVVENNIQFHGYHFPYPGIGTVRELSSGRYEFEPKSTQPLRNEPGALFYSCVGPLNECDTRLSKSQSLRCST